MAEVLGKEFDGFKEALQQGAASVHEKFQLQKHFDDFKAFLKKAEKVGAEKFGDLTHKMEKDLSEVDSSKLTIEKPKTQEQEFDEIMKQAEQLIDTEITEKDEDLDANHKEINKLFDDLDEK